MSTSEASAKEERSVRYEYEFIPSKAAKGGRVEGSPLRKG